MTREITFIHAADLHLGAPLRGLRALSESWANRLLTALTEAYDRVISAALAREVDFVVLAGDIFDSGKCSYRDYLHFFQGLEKLNEAGIKVYLVAGNHDPFTSWEKGSNPLPPNATMFPGDKPGYEMYVREDEPLCLIAGRGYYNQTWSSQVSIAEGVTRVDAENSLREQYVDVENTPFAVGVLHTGLDLDPIKAPVNRTTLMNAGMDYWALGHIHKRFVYPSMDNPRLVFSGCTQGRDVNETDTRGVYQVTLREGKSPSIEWIPTASVVWQRLLVDITDCQTLPEVTERAMREQFKANGNAHCEEMVSRITLTGKTELHRILERGDTMEAVREHINASYNQFFCDSLINQTEMPRDKEALRKEGLFPSLLMQIAKEQASDGEESIEYVQNALLDARLQVSAECIQEIPTLAIEAENLVLDLLCQEEVRG